MPRPVWLKNRPRAGRAPFGSKNRPNVNSPILWSRFGHLCRAPFGSKTGPERGAPRLAQKPAQRQFPDPLVTFRPFVPRPVWLKNRPRAGRAPFGSKNRPNVNSPILWSRFGHLCRAPFGSKNRPRAGRAPFGSKTGPTSIPRSFGHVSAICAAPRLAQKPAQSGARPVWLKNRPNVNSPILWSLFGHLCRAPFGSKAGPERGAPRLAQKTGPTSIPRSFGHFSAICAAPRLAQKPAQSGARPVWLKNRPNVNSPILWSRFGHLCRAPFGSKTGPERGAPRLAQKPAQRQFPDPLVTFRPFVPRPVWLKNRPRAGRAPFGSKTGPTSIPPILWSRFGHLCRAPFGSKTGPERGAPRLAQKPAQRQFPDPLVTFRPFVPRPVWLKKPAQSGARPVWLKNRPNVNSPILWSRFGHLCRAPFGSKTGPERGAPRLAQKPAQRQFPDPLVTFRPFVPRPVWLKNRPRAGARPVWLKNRPNVNSPILWSRFGHLCRAPFGSKTGPERGAPRLAQKPAQRQFPDPLVTFRPFVPRPVWLKNRPRAGRAPFGSKTGPTSIPRSFGHFSAICAAPRLAQKPAQSGARPVWLKNRPNVNSPILWSLFGHLCRAPFGSKTGPERGAPRLAQKPAQRQFPDPLVTFRPFVPRPVWLKNRPRTGRGTNAPKRDQRIVKSTLRLDLSQNGAPRLAQKPAQRQFPDPLVTFRPFVPRPVWLKNRPRAGRGTNAPKRDQRIVKSTLRLDLSQNGAPRFCSKTGPTSIPRSFGHVSAICAAPRLAQKPAQNGARHQCAKT